MIFIFNQIYKTALTPIIAIVFFAIGLPQALKSQAPANDDCANAILIPITADGFGVGNFMSVQSDLTNATAQTGEAYAPALFVAGLDKKSVWYKFSIPTIRAVRVTLSQPGTAITAGDAGFTVYQTNACLPDTAAISGKLTPIATFGNTYHPCVPAGDYLIQVSSKLAAAGPININLEISDQTGALYDHPVQAYSFGTAINYARKIDFEPECYSIEDPSEACNSLLNYKEYHKSAWFTFTTPGYFDYLVFTLSGNGNTTYFPSGGIGIFKKFGYKLYQGDVVTTAYNTLPLIDGCDSLETDGYQPAIKQYQCNDLQPSTTYSLQLFFQKDFKDVLRLGILTGGNTPTAAPLPVTGIATALGTLPVSPTGSTTTVLDYFGCNSRHSVTACGTAIPVTGITIGNTNYNLSSFVTFTLTSAASITFRPGMTICGARPVIRLFKQTLTGNCADLDMANLAGTASYNQEIECLQPGDYVIQVLGTDAPLPLNSYTYITPANNIDQCLFTNLGSRYKLDMIAYTRTADHKYSLSSFGAFDSINRAGAMQQPLVSGVPYLSSPDIIGCQPTLRPWDTTCSPLNNKVIYRQFIVADSGTVDFSTLVYSTNSPLRYRLYGGDANALANAQGVFLFPDKVNGIVPKSLCIDGYTFCENKTVCVLPGTYTFTTMGSDADVGTADRPTITFVKTRTKHNSPFTAQDMGNIMDTLGVNGGTKKSDEDYWSCDDNAEPINGYLPCTLGGIPATKAIYRQFYLKSNAVVKIANTSYNFCNQFAYGSKTLFYGKATDGLSGLTPVGNQWNCFAIAQTTNGCTFLPAGWYTVVSYGTGPDYDNPMRLLNVGGRYNSYVSYKDEFNISITPACPGPAFNRPYKASVNSSNQPHLVQWVNRVNSTLAYPRNDTIYTLPAENFNCTLDTPFSSHPVKACSAVANRVAYWVFKTTEICYLQINTGNYLAAVYEKDIRTDSLQFATALPIQQCSNKPGAIQFCFFQPGTYTLVVFATDVNICNSIAPKLYIDKIDHSRFDFAANAYDFDVVPANNTFYNGKVGDVNPLNSLRAPSNDFFYCTTGAAPTDPSDGVCNAVYNPNVYNNGPNKSLFDSAFPAGTDITRRNLWYTFVADAAGTVTIKVENKTAGRGFQPKFAVYRSDVDGSLPFSTVVAGGLVDSTFTQGLRLIGTNPIFFPYHCYNTLNNLSFYRDPCTSVRTRYYVVVENVNADPVEIGGLFPNSQVEVAVSIDPVIQVLPTFDHYYQAGDFGNIGAGTYIGPADNYSCASRDATDPVYTTYPNCAKTIWYKFTTGITGNVRYRIKVNNIISFNYDQVQLFRQTIPGDSTVNGLKIQLFSTINSPNGNWAQTCIAPGTYYLLLPGCGRVNEFVFPEIELIEAVGDFCSRAVPAVIAGPGAVTASVLVNCHTIATDYGEFGPQLTCPPNATTSQYKSSWFRMDITGTDTLDVTTYLQENTNAASADIKYRLMTGDCSAMQEQSCVLDALTQNTYQCLVPGQSYYVQVFTPLVKNTVQVTGTIDLKLSAIKHADTCSPLTNCLASANFTPQFDCTRNDSVQFINFSTYGTSIHYQWDFGYNAQTSAAVSPSFFYPALPVDQTYTVKLIVTNTSCSKIDSVIRTITIPARPYANLGADIVQCNRNAAPVVLRATSHPAATYLWQNNSTADSLVVTASGNNNYWVRISYNGCISTDTIRILNSTIAAKPLQQINVCGDSVLVDVRRGFGETYRWNTGAVTRSIYMSTPGYYWADISYFDCVYRDSFKVSNVTVYNPLGNDTTICLSNAGYILNAATTGAITYTWQNNSTADSLLVTAPGQYYVTINLGNCSIKDTVNILGYPAPLTVITDTSICAGASFFLPWGPEVKKAGTYSDTIQNIAGCDSLIQQVNLSVKAKPDIGNDRSFCSLSSGYTLNATTTGAFSYTWQDGATGALYNVSQAGLYIVQVNFGSCVAVDSVNIQVFSSPVTVSTDTSICAGKTINLPWGLSVQNAGTYKDTLRSVPGCDSLIRIYIVKINSRPLLGNDTSVNGCSGNSIDLTRYFNTAGLTSNWTINNIPVINPAAVNVQGNYHLIATNINGCSDTALLSLTINSKPQLGNDTIISACNGTSINLTNIYNTTGLTAIWIQNTIPVNNPAAVNANGIYQLIAASAAGCTDTTMVTLNFNGQPVIVINNPGTRCIPQTINLTAPAVTSGSTAGIAFTYWLDSTCTTAFNDAATATDGTYYIKGTTSTGCFEIKPVTVKSYPIQTVNAGNDIGICNNDSVATLTVTVTNTTAPVSYQWEPLNAGIVTPGSFSTIVKPTLTPQQYIISVTDGYGCNYTIRDTITVSKQPPVKAFAGNDTVASVGLPHQLNATGGVNFMWSPQNLLNNPFIANPQATIYADSVLFAVEVKDAFGCKGYDTIKIKTYNGITYYVPNAFSPNGDGWNDVFHPIPVGIVSTETFRIYNRYGQLMFETSQLSKGWDGTFKGKAQPAANYVWLLKGKGRNGKTIAMKGNVVLVR